MSAQPKPVDWDALVQLFEPGSGVMPPHLAGRDRELKTLNRFRADLADKRPPPSDAILYGPRGNGKTVLLDAFLAKCLEAGIAARPLDASEIETPEALARELPAAKRAAELFARSAGRSRTAFQAARLEDRLAAAEGLPSEAAREALEDAREALAQLSALGFIWQQEERPAYEAGIPSLMNYVLEAEAPGAEPAAAEESRAAPGP